MLTDIIGGKPAGRTTSSVSSRPRRPRLLSDLTRASWARPLPPRGHSPRVQSPWIRQTQARPPRIRARGLRTRLSLRAIMPTPASRHVGVTTVTSIPRELLVTEILRRHLRDDADRAALLEVSRHFRDAVREAIAQDRAAYREEVDSDTYRDVYGSASEDGASEDESPSSHVDERHQSSKRRRKRPILRLWLPNFVSSPRGSIGRVAAAPWNDPTRTRWCARMPRVTASCKRCDLRGRSSAFHVTAYRSREPPREGISIAFATSTRTGALSPVPPSVWRRRKGTYTSWSIYESKWASHPTQRMKAFARLLLDKGGGTSWNGRIRTSGAHGGGRANTPPRKDISRACNTRTRTGAGGTLRRAERRQGGGTSTASDTLTRTGVFGIKGRSRRRP